MAQDFKSFFDVFEDFMFYDIDLITGKTLAKDDSVSDEMGEECNLS